MRFYSLNGPMPQVLFPGVENEILKSGFEKITDKQN
jgi:hypothetical protein